MKPESHMPVEPGLKVAAQMDAETTEEDFRFARQMGVDHAVAWCSPDKASAEYYRHCRALYDRNGVRLYGLGNGGVHNVAAITLNFPGRDEKVEEYKQHLRNLGQADIPYTTYAHMANGVWSTPREATRGGASARAFDVDRLEEEAIAGGGFGSRPELERDYTEEEIWENFTSFIKEVAPVAEEAGVRVGIHPDDPPGLVLGRVPRVIFSSFEGYKRALEIADSPNVGCVCASGAGWRAVRLWAMVWRRRFATLVVWARFSRCITEPWTDLYHTLWKLLSTTVTSTCITAMKALGEVGFDGVLIPDHIPAMADDHKVGTAYTIAYMKALVKRANKDLDS